MDHANTPSFPVSVPRYPELTVKQRELMMNSLGFRDTKQKDRKQRWTSELWCMFGGKARLGGLGRVLRDSECSGRRMLR